MDYRQLPVPGELHVELHRVTAKISGGLKTRQSIFRGQSRGAPMTGNMYYMCHRYMLNQ